MKTPIVEPRDWNFVAGVLGCIDGTFRPMANPVADPSLRDEARRLYRDYGVWWGCAGTDAEKAAFRRDALRCHEYGVVAARFVNAIAFVKLPDRTEHFLRRLLWGGGGLDESFRLLAVLGVTFGEWTAGGDLPGVPDETWADWHMLPLLARGLAECRAVDGATAYRATDAALLFDPPSDLDAGPMPPAGWTEGAAAEMKANYFAGIEAKDRDLKLFGVPRESRG